MTIVLVILILIGAYVGFMSEMDDNTKKIVILIIVILVLLIILIGVLLLVKQNYHL